MRLLRHLPRFRRAYQALETLAAREGWSRAEIEAWQLERLNAVWGHAIAHVPYYRRLAAAAHLAPHFATLKEFHASVPVLPKSVVRAQPADFLSEAAGPGHWGRTGGSTGTPMGCFWGRQAHLEMLRCRYRMQAAWGVDFLERTAMLWGHSASLKPGLPGRLARLRTPIEDWLRNRLRLSAYHVGRDDLRGYLRRLARFRPALIYGYSRALHLLAQEVEATGFRCDSLKVLTLTGEPAFDHLVAGIERSFGVPAAVEYGAVECGFLAGEGPDRSLRIREDVAFIETLPTDDGRNEILVTVLNNPSFPLLRYAIGDVTDVPLQAPAHGFAVLKNVAGRNNDLILSRSGRFLHSARFDAFFKYETRHVRRFRVRQHADGALSVAVELDDPGASVDLPALEARLRELVDGYPVKVQLVQAVPQTPAGKHRLVVSDLDLAAPPSDKRLLNGHANGNGHPNGASRISFPLPEHSSLAVSCSKATRFKSLVQSPELTFLMEAHNGLSAKIVEEAGFDAIWASGLSMSAALGVRDSNEASWTQVLEVLEFMSDSARIPILVDGDTGYGNFNNMRRLVQKLEQRQIGGVCIEDKIFPKTNSFLNGTAQPLADIDEFCGRIKAGKDAQKCEDFVIVARVEAFIAGWGLKEALKRAEAYRQAGADAVLIHSAKRTADEILAFMAEWGGRLPVVIVPTKYYSTPTEVFRKHGISAVIWANHLMRSCITAMQRTAQEIFETQTLVRVEDRVAPLAEVFRLQGAHELEEAEKRYLPKGAGKTRALILAAARGHELGAMTEDRPKCMVQVSGTPVLGHIAATFRAAGIKDIAVVRGYRKETVDLGGLTYFDNDDHATTGEAWSLYQARPALDSACVVCHGDVLFKKYVPQELMDVEADFVVAVDANWQSSRRQDRNAPLVTCSQECTRQASLKPVHLKEVAADLAPARIDGEWMGLLKVSQTGAAFLRALLAQLATDGDRLRRMSLADLLREIIRAGKEVRVVYTAGHWLDIDSVEDVLAAGSFQ
jgi:phosphoenolpyruvate phosphomutase